MMESTKYKYRHLAKVTLEAVTPIAVGSGEKSIMTDSVVATDVNGMPYLPGTSVAGLLRHAIGDEEQAKAIFGFQEGKKGHGSLLSVTDAVMVGLEGQPLDDLQSLNDTDGFYDHYRFMPIRQHVRIDGKGTAEKSGKFDGQVAFKGTRFVFEAELCSEQPDKDVFLHVMDLLARPDFRVGSGTRSGYGHVRVVSILTAHLDLQKQTDLESYLLKSSCLSDIWSAYAPYTIPMSEESNGWEHFHVDLFAEDFFLFGSGFSDDEADMTPVREEYVEWTQGESPRPCFKEGTLIPASSVKGALLHRTAFWWNKLNERYADDGRGLAADKNPAVVAIFGTAANDEDVITRGRLIMDDFIVPERDTKIVNHVSIDRFTGGALDGALFTERVTDGAGMQPLALDIYVQQEAFKGDATIRSAFEKALDDLRSGMLPLGGGTNRGNGIFREKK